MADFHNPEGTLGRPKKQERFSLEQVKSGCRTGIIIGIICINYKPTENTI